MSADVTTVEPEANEATGLKAANSSDKRSEASVGKSNRTRWLQIKIRCALYLSLCELQNSFPSIKVVSRASRNSNIAFLIPNRRSVNLAGYTPYDLVVSY